MKEAGVDDTEGVVGCWRDLGGGAGEVVGVEAVGEGDDAGGLGEGEGGLNFARGLRGVHDHQVGAVECAGHGGEVAPGVVAGGVDFGFIQGPGIAKIEDEGEVGLLLKRDSGFGGGEGGHGDEDGAGAVFLEELLRGFDGGFDPPGAGVGGVEPATPFLLEVGLIFGVADDGVGREVFEQGVVLHLGDAVGGVGAVGDDERLPAGLGEVFSEFEGSLNACATARRKEV
jgi:hypothetical protein